MNFIMIQLQHNLGLIILTDGLKVDGISPIFIFMIKYINFSSNKDQ